MDIRSRCTQAMRGVRTWLSARRGVPPTQGERLDQAGTTDLPVGFDDDFYLMVHGDVADAGMGPRDHFLLHGRHEGRLGVPPRAIHPMEAELYDRWDFFRRAFSAIQFNGIAGDYAEFGVANGKAFWCAYRAARAVGRPCRMWAYDSFAGLPSSDHPADAHPMWRAGNFSVSRERFEERCRVMGIRSEDLVIVEGFFDETLVIEDNLPRDLCLAYVDCDMYASTAAVLRALDTRLTQGVIVAFDDYYCWSGEGMSAEYLAVTDFLTGRPDVRFHPYIQFGWHGMSFVVERRASPIPAAIGASIGVHGRERSDG